MQTYRPSDAGEIQRLVVMLLLTMHWDADRGDNDAAGEDVAEDAAVMVLLLMMKLVAVLVIYASAAASGYSPVILLF